MHRRAPRLADPLYRGPIRCAFTIATAHRAPFFAEPETARAAIVQFRQPADEAMVALLAWCLMPDHVHLLVEGRGPAARPLQFVGRWKQRVGYWFARANGQRLWQEGFYDRILREGDDSFAATAYILANPVRAGLAMRIGEYPFAGSDVYAPNVVASIETGRRG